MTHKQQTLENSRKMFWKRFENIPFNERMAKEITELLSTTYDQAYEKGKESVIDIVTDLATGPNCRDKPRCCGYHDACEDILNLASPKEE